MDKAKAAVHDFMAKAGHNDTTVHERVAPAVTHETIERHKHEEVQAAIDKEIHQDHYHTSIQPVYDRQVLPEQHMHRVAEVETREFRHGPDHREISSKLEREAAQFADKRVEGQVRETRSSAPVVAGEHIHHHVHETIQPVVQKETILPQVIHTTVPVHEVHHNPPQHHSASALPAVSMADFKKQGGVLTGREERYDGFEGEPRAIGTALGSQSGPLHAAANSTTTHHNRSRSRSRDRVTGTGTGMTGRAPGPAVPGHPTMGEKLNPRIDSDGDGKAGIMS